MSNNLETPFDVILNENKIRSICQDRNTIISVNFLNFFFFKSLKLNDFSCLGFKTNKKFRGQ